jgi:cob(I)alamin adenosyltransferase
LDETNSFLGVCKVKSKELGLILPSGVSLSDFVHSTQKNLFIVQAEVAGSKISITQEKVIEIESIIDVIEKELPPIKSFFISGGSELATLFDFARTISRRAERRVVGVVLEGKIEVGEFTKSYLNRLSSLLYAFARFSNHKANITEERPDYK